jgi:acetyltransferase-like isoleucine patch superfamily enzyme
VLGPDSSIRLRQIWQRVNRLYSVRANVELGKDVHIGLGSALWAPHKLTIGDGVYIGKYCTIETDGVIGANSMIANNAGIIGRYDHDHRSIGRAIRQAPWIGDSDYEGAGKGLQADLGEDVWIGFGAVVLSGATVGRGGIVAAGSVVSGAVAPYAIVAGQPARQVGVRFDSDEVVAHETALYGRVLTNLADLPG